MTKTLKQLQEEHPEWCWKCGYHSQDLCESYGHDCYPELFDALIAAKREDEARIAEHAAFKESLWAIVKQTAQEEPQKPKELTADSLREFIGQHHLWGREGWAKANSLEALLTAEQQAHAETKRQLGEVDRALVEMAMNDNPSEETARAYHQALARQASINRPADNSPTDDRGEGEK